MRLLIKFGLMECIIVLLYCLIECIIVLFNRIYHCITVGDSSLLDTRYWSKLKKTKYFKSRSEDVGRLKSSRCRLTSPSHDGTTTEHLNYKKVHQYNNLIF